MNISRQFAQSLIRPFNGIVRSQSSFADSKLHEVLDAIKAVDREDNKKQLFVRWENGRQGAFPYVWLRDNDTSSHTYNISDVIRARHMLFKDLDPNIIPSKVHASEEGLTIWWPDSQSESFYSSDWLLSRNLCDPEVHKKRQNLYLDNSKVPWNVESLNKQLKFFDFDEAMSNDSVLLEALEFMNNFGLLFFKNVPAEQGQASRLGKKLGYAKTSSFGETFHVKVETNPADLAYTSKEIGLHTDLAFTDNPDIAALHCIRSSGGGKGGENQFADIFHIAQLMKEHYPEHYAILCRTPMEYIADIKEHGTAYQLISRHKTFETDEHNNFVKGCFANQTRTWYYPTTSPEELKSIYAAMFKFQELFRHPDNMIQVRLKAGEMVMYCNFKVMHARSDFEVSPGTNRHLEGIFYTWDAVRSKILSLRRKLNVGEQHVTI